ncbi:TetR/AcrR family transcriptional regulator [Paenibacillus sp. VCA1]|uniref:TetR/AcrR family transcriptional regulator n=1 Tax=Paenibacillus sp. VCA1 TaxID=3039148 RepID=UPI0028715A6E|nr:TetR/AcrR family transcriptional regulator [Paenibacillus sp. VCA1]MDR9857005.1 TetR/AcrR family transcriptional regulator [Paenibacillus sp. VCA1]
MSPLNRQQLDQIRDERREQIKQAALKEFARRGYKGTKTSSIAKEAGISEGLIYRYFQSKDELFITLIQELMEEAKRELDEAQHVPGTPYEQIRSLTENMLNPQDKYSFMFIERARKADDIPEEARQIFAQLPPGMMTDLLVPVFMKGQELGEFSPGDPRKILSWYLTILNSLIVQDEVDEKYGLPDADTLMRFLTK